MQAHVRPHIGAPDGDDAAVAPVELLCAEADHALQQLQGNKASPSWTSSSSEDTPSLPSAHSGEDENSSMSGSVDMPVSESADEQSMWVDEQIAEAEFLQQLEDSDSPVEATAQLSLPMFPDLASAEAPSGDQHLLDNSGSEKGTSLESSREAAGKAEGHVSSKAAQAPALNSAVSMPELDEDYVTPAGSPRKQAASAPPVLDLRFARSDSLSSAASHPCLNPRKHSTCRSSGGLRLTHLVCHLLQSSVPTSTAPQVLRLTYCHVASACRVPSSNTHAAAVPTCDGTSAGHHTRAGSLGQYRVMQRVTLN